MSEALDIFVGPDELAVEEVTPLEGFRIWVRLNSGVAGELDLTEIAKSPWFQRWQDRDLFEDVRITSSGRTIVWGDDPDESDLAFCIIRLYVELTGQTWEEFQTEAKKHLVHA